MSSLEHYGRSFATPQLFDGLQVQEVVRPLLRTPPAVMVRCTDGFHYIIHQPGSCLGDAALAASLLGPAIARSMGFTIASSSPVAVDDHLSARQREAPKFSGEPVLTQAGLYSASRLAGSISGHQWAVPYVTPRRWSSVLNHGDILGMQLLRKWAGSDILPKAMFRRTEDRRSLIVVFIGVNQLFANIISGTSHALYETSRASPTDGLMKEAEVAWFIKLQEAAQLACEATIPTLVAKWPALNLSSLNDVLLSRLKQMERG